MTLEIRWPGLYITRMALSEIRVRSSTRIRNRATLNTSDGITRLGFYQIRLLQITMRSKKLWIKAWKKPESEQIRLLESFGMRGNKVEIVEYDDHQMIKKRTTSLFDIKDNEIWVVSENGKQSTLSSCSALSDAQ